MTDSNSCQVRSHKGENQELCEFDAFKKDRNFKHIHFI